MEWTRVSGYYNLYMTHFFFSSLLIHSHTCIPVYTCIRISLSLYTCVLLTGDQLILYYGFPHRSVKWWKRAFFHLLDLALVNSHILFQLATSSRMTQLEYRISVAQSLLEDSNATTRQPQSSQSASQRGLFQSPSLIERRGRTAKFVA